MSHASSERALHGEWSLVLLLGALTGVGQLGISICLPSLSSIREELHVSVSGVQATLSAYLVGLALTQLIYGPVSDVLGRRSVIIVGLAICVAGGVIAMLAPNISVLVMARFCQGSGACAGIVVGRALARDIFTGPRLLKALSAMAMVFAVVPAVAPLLGGVLQQLFGWRATLFATVVAGLALLLAAHARIHDAWKPTITRLDASIILSSYARVLRCRTFVRFAVSMALVYASFFAFSSGAPAAFMEQLGLTPIQYGLASTSCTIWYIAGSYLSTRAVQRWGTGRTIALALTQANVAVIALIISSLCFGATLWGLLVPMYLFTLSMGLMLPAGLAAALQELPQSAGAASALLGCAQMAAAAVSAIAVGGAGSWPEGGFPVIMLSATMGAAVALWITRAVTESPGPARPHSRWT